MRSTQSCNSRISELASRRRNIKPRGRGRAGEWSGGEGGLCCRAGALGLPQWIWGVRRLSVIPHSGSSTWDLFSCWMGRQAAQEDSHFRPASVAVNASRQRRADTRPRVSSLNTPLWTVSPPPPCIPCSHTEKAHRHRACTPTHTHKIMISQPLVFFK